MVYEINLYDSCVGNKIINGGKKSIRWNVDNVMESHKYPNLNSEFAKAIKEKYWKIKQITVHRVKVHDYLAIEFNYENIGEVKLSMEKYITKIVNDFLYKDEMPGTAITPAATYLF